MDKYEVTNAQYAKFLNEYGKNEDSDGHELINISSEDCLIERSGSSYRSKSGYENHPVIRVSWYGAKAYAEYYGKRLPTEAEWEKAARGGLVGKKYPWGDEDPDGTQCNFADKNIDYSWSDKNVDDGYQYTAPVGSYTPNGYGLYDMAGNVWEWCSDWYDSDYYSSSPRSNPRGPSTGSRRLLRGGWWYDNSDNIRVAARYGLGPHGTYGTCGFRCCVSPDLTP